MQTTVIHHRAHFEDWTILAGPFVNHSVQKTEYLCRCKCGTERRVRENNLKTGTSTNCGCRRRAVLIARNRQTTGGIWVERPEAAHAWDRMIRRCYDPKAKGYHNYGGRGITVCDRWRGPNGMENFIADMGDPPPGKSLGRIQNDDPYSPDNCQWETDEQQQSNKRTNVFGYLNGLRMTAAQIGREIGKQSSAVSRDIKKGLYANNSGLS